MKNYIYQSILLLFIFILFVNRLSAQTCNANFTVNVISTESTCQSNGTVTVSLSGDITDLINIQYGLSTPGDPDGFKVQPQDKTTMTGVPPGIYDVTVRAFCAVDDEYDVVKTISNVVVTGNYVVPVASLSAGNSQKSYSHCSTGKIALEVINGNGNFTFIITSAPSSTLEGAVNATNIGTIYTLDGKYPAGNYIVEVTDGLCYTTTATFTLGSITGYPSFSYYETNFSPISPYSSCSEFNWNLGTVGTSNGDYYDYYRAGMYEVATAVGNETPTNWKIWNSSSLRFDIAPKKYSDAYSTNSGLKVYIRVKGCEDPGTYYSLSTSLKTGNAFGNSVSSYRCNDYYYQFYPYTDYDGLFCYPYSIEVKEGSTVKWSVTGKHQSDGYQYVTLDYGIAYTYSIKDVEGNIIESNNLTVDRSTPSFSYLNGCNTFNLKYTFPLCHNLDVEIKNSSNVVIHSNTVTSSEYLPANGIDLNYNEQYTLTATNISENYNYSTTIKRGRATSYTLTLNNSTSDNSLKCNENYGRFRVNGAGNSNYLNNYWPAGTKLTLTGPAGFVTQTYTYSSTSHSYNYSFNYSYAPAGTYTVTVDDGCGGTPLTAQYVYTGGYNASAFTYDSKVDCDGLIVTPKGQLTYLGNNQSGTYYRIVSGPSGYDKNTVVQYNASNPKSFTFSTPGTYKLGVMNTNSSVGCYLRTIDIVYDHKPFELDKIKTTAYVCDGEIIGHILISGKNGKMPYKYELWDVGKTTKHEEQEVRGGAHFNFGSAGVSYTIVVTDSCGNNFDHTVDVVNLATARIVYANNGGQICKGDPILLNCMTLGETEYRWEGPNGWSAANVQNPVIPNAQMNMSGWYKVIVKPEFCGKDMKDSIYITVNDLPDAPTVNNTALAYCENDAAPSLVIATGAIEDLNHTLKWYDSDGTTVIIPPAMIGTPAGIQEYYVSQVNDNTGCESDKIKITITVLSRPVAPATISPVIDKCPNEIFTITVQSPLAGYIYKVYDAISGGNLLGTSAVGSGVINGIVAPATSGSKTYYVAAVASSGTTTCESSIRTSVNFIVKIGAAANDISVSGNLDVCFGGQTTITLGSTGVTNPVYKWYTSQTAPLPESTDNPRTFTNVTTNLTYYVSVSGSNACENEINNRKEIVVTVNSLPDFPLVNTTTEVCKNANVMLTFGPTVSGNIYTLYDAATGGVIKGSGVGNGGNLTINCGTAPAGAPEYYLEIENNITGCKTATRQKYTGLVTAYPVLPTTVTASNICSGTTLTVSIATALTGHTYEVYDVATGGTPKGSAVGNGGTININCGAVSGSGSTNYYVQVTKDNISCTNPTRKVVNFTIYDLPVLPPSATVTVPQVCTGSNIIIYISNSIVGYKYKIYDVNTGGTALNGSGTVGNGTTKSISCGTLSIPFKDFYIEVENSNNCISLGRLRVTASIRETVYSYPSIRVWACPQNTINLTKYTDITDFGSVVWAPASSFNSGGINNGTLIDATVLNPGQTYTYDYTVTNSCATDGAKLYLTIVNGNNVRPNTDEVRICKDFARSIQLNPIFGIETPGTWTCAPAAANTYLNILTTAPFTGTAVFNGEDAWADSSIPFAGANKEITVTFTPAVGSCLHGQSYTVKIILTPDLTN